MKPRSQPMGPKSVRGSETARRHAAIVLEALSGLRTTQSASDAMGVAMPRYYVLEARALQAFVLALEPRPRGRQVSAFTELEKLRTEIRRLERDAARMGSLYRASQRVLGVSEPKATMGSKQPGKRRRRPRKRARAELVVRTLQAPVAGQEGGGSDGDGTA